VSRLARAAIDTSVVIEYIDLRGELHEQAEVVFSAALAGRLEIFIPHAVLAETFYVATKIYRTLGVERAEAVASKLVEWLYRLPTARVVGEGVQLALEAGGVKLAYNLALTDCYMLAVSKLYGCTAVFKKREREMLRNIGELERNYKLLFLEDYR